MSIIVAGAMEYLDDDRVIASDNTASLRATYLQWVEVTGTTLTSPRIECTEAEPCSSSQSR